MMNHMASISSGNKEAWYRKVISLSGSLGLAAILLAAVLLSLGLSGLVGAAGDPIAGPHIAVDSCSVEEDGSGSHATIQAAVSDAACDMVMVGAGTFSETVTIGRSVVVEGQGAGLSVVDGNASGSVFVIEDGWEVTISGLTIQNGSANGGGGIDNGGSLRLVNSTVTSNTATWSGGGICNCSGILTMTGSTVSDNTAGWGGGGIYDLGRFTIADSVIMGNSAADWGGGGMFVGGGYQTEIVTNSVFKSNSAMWGGGIDLEGGILDVSHSTFSDNTAIAGGALSNQYNGRLTVRHSTINSNTASVGGGIDSNDWLTVTHSTVSGNMAQSNGGGLYVSRGFTLTHSTVSDNSAGGEGGGIYGTPQSGYMANSIVANNTGGGDCSGDIVSEGHNLDSDSTCGLDGPGDISASYPKLGPLQDNGGPTWSHDLLAGSPALDAGSCPGETVDQRGFFRPFDLHLVANAADGCDIGALEHQASPIVGLAAHNNGPTLLHAPTTFNVSLTAGEFSTYTWDFGDGEQGVGIEATHTYTMAGLYTATVTASNDEGSALASTAVEVIVPDPVVYLPLALKSGE
ncbi:MAG: choice-of-anchor Q domain-containing protein [Chloroflexota bacterium]